MKPVVLTHNLNDGTFTESEPIIMRWNGTDMPSVLRRVKPGQYVLLPFQPTDDIVRPARKAACGKGMAPLSQRAERKKTPKTRQK